MRITLHEVLINQQMPVGRPPVFIESNALIPIDRAPLEFTEMLQDCPLLLVDSQSEAEKAADETLGLPRSLWK